MNKKPSFEDEKNIFSAFLKSFHWSKEKFLFAKWESDFNAP